MQLLWSDQNGGEWPTAKKTQRVKHQIRNSTPVVPSDGANEQRHRPDENTEPDQSDEKPHRDVSVSNQWTRKSTLADRCRPRSKTPIHVDSQRVEQQKHHRIWQSRK